MASAQKNEKSGELGNRKKKKTKQKNSMELNQVPRCTEKATRLEKRKKTVFLTALRFHCSCINKSFLLLIILPFFLVVEIERQYAAGGGWWGEPRLTGQQPSGDWAGGSVCIVTGRRRKVAACRWRNHQQRRELCEIDARSSRGVFFRLLGQFSSVWYCSPFLFFVHFFS